jgi:hypothetical protein
LNLLQTTKMGSHAERPCVEITGALDVVILKMRLLSHARREHICYLRDNHRSSIMFIQPVR